MKRFMSLTFILALGFISCGDDKQPMAPAELTGPIAAGKVLTDADATRDGAEDLGDITDLSEAQFPRNTLNGSDDAVDYYKFRLTAAKAVGLALRQLDLNADLFFEDDAGTVLASSENSGTANEWIEQTLLAGTYYVRVQAQETGENAYVFRYGVEEAPDEDEDATRDGAGDLGDITDLSEAQFPGNTLNGSDDAVDYYKFRLTAAKAVGLALRQLDFNADLFFEDDAGTVLASSENSGTDNEWIEQTLLAGTYYARVQAQETGENAYVFRYGVEAPDADEVARLEGQNEQTTTQEEEEEDHQHEDATQEEEDHQHEDTRNIGGVLNTDEGDTDAPADASTTATIVADDKLYMSGNQEPIIFRGNISHSDDVDWIRVMLKEDMVFIMTVLGKTSDNDRTLTKPHIEGLYRGDNDYISGTHAAINAFSPYRSKIIYTADANANYYVAVESLGGETGTYLLRVLWVPDDIHPDNTNTQGTLTVGGSYKGSIQFRGDEDWFKVDLTGGTTYQVEVTDRSPAKRQFYPKVTLRNSAGRTIEKDTGSSSVVSSYTPASTGTYFIVASSLSRQSESSVAGRVGRYTLTLSEE